MAISTTACCIESLTVTHDEEINSQNSKALANTIIRVLELALHDSSEDLDEHDSRQSADKHSMQLSVSGTREILTQAA